MLVEKHARPVRSNFLFGQSQTPLPLVSLNPYSQQLPIFACLKGLENNRFGEGGKLEATQDELSKGRLLRASAESGSLNSPL